MTTAPTQFSSLGYLLLGRPSGEAPPRHVSFFSPATLARVLASEGLQVVGKSMNVEIQQLTRACREVFRRGKNPPQHSAQPAAVAPTNLVEPLDRWSVRRSSGSSMPAQRLSMSATKLP